jgi:hypothetical protein
VHVSDQFQVKVSNRFAPLKNVGDSVGISSTWENIRGNIKISDRECIVHIMSRGSMNHGFYEYSKFLGQTKQTNCSGDNLHKLVEFSGIKRGTIWKVK